MQKSINSYKFDILTSIFLSFSVNVVSRTEIFTPNDSNSSAAEAFWNIQLFSKSNYWSSRFLDCKRVLYSTNILESKFLICRLSLIFLLFISNIHSHSAIVHFRHSAQWLDSLAISSFQHCSSRSFPFFRSWSSTVRSPFSNSPEIINSIPKLPLSWPLMQLPHQLCYELPAIFGSSLRFSLCSVHFRLKF